MVVIVDANFRPFPFPSAKVAYQWGSSSKYSSIFLVINQQCTRLQQCIHNPCNMTVSNPSRQLTTSDVGLCSIHQFLTDFCRRD